MTKLHRRSILRALAASTITLPLAGLFEKSASGGTFTAAKRLIVVYFPDGIPEPPGGPSQWYAQGQGSNVTLSTCLQPLAPYLSSCCFFRNLSMGPTDSGSHPGGAKKLLTATDGGNGISLDRYLASTIGAQMPFRHVYLGAMALQNNATGDKFVSYVAPGTTVPPEDDPVKAFATLFGGPNQTTQQVAGPDAGSILDNALAELGDLESQLGATEKTKLDLHVQALRDTEKRIQSLANETPACNQSIASVGTIDETRLYDAAQFPAVLKAQMDVMVQAMACGLTSVGVIQMSEHTSELIMSRFQNTPMYDPNYDMRSHQASHYGVSSDPKFASYVLQRTWIVQQLAYLLSQLAARPEGSGSMLDDTIVLLCSEIADGNTHSHDDMGFVLAGGTTALRTGKLYDFGYRRHADLLLTIGNALGDTMTSFGDSSSGQLPGLLAI